MGPSAKKALKYTGIVAGVLVVLLAAAGGYIYTLIPKPTGQPIVLQADLFRKPDQPLLMEGKYIYRPATELSQMMRSGQVKSEDVVREFIANIRNNNWRYNAVIWLREQEAMAEARQADEAIARGDTAGRPLLGVPVTIKEMFWVKGSPSTMNAKMYRFTAPYDGTVVARIKKAGAIILGTTNVPYMLSDYQTQGEVYPTGKNPYDTTRTPGGSTGGGAAALAAGFTSIELGSDMGGSIRIPSAFCGLYGLKTTFGTINMTEGVGPDTTTKYKRLALACTGPLARTPEDLELMWAVIRDTKADPRFPMAAATWRPATARTPDAYRIAWTDEWGAGNASGDVKAKLKQFIDSLANRHAFTERAAPDVYKTMNRLFYGQFACMIGEGQPWALRKLIGMEFKKWDDGSGDMDEFFDAMSDNSDARWDELQAKAKQLRAEWETFFKKYDFLICPITYGPAIKHCTLGTALPGDNNTTMPYARYFGFGSILNTAGLPSIIIPMGLNKDGLPLAIQVTGNYYSEPELLHFAKITEAMVPGFIRPHQ